MGLKLSKKKNKSSKVEVTEDRIRKVSEVKLTYYDNNKCDEATQTPVRRRKHTTVHFKDTTIDVCRNSKDIAIYCLPLLTANFAGQTTSSIKNDVIDDNKLGNLHLGMYLQLVDDYLRHQFKTVQEFTGTEKFYLKLLSYIAVRRKTPGENDEEAYQRLLEDSQRFVKIYHERGSHSQELKDHKNYWGSRQQLLSGKVIADWIDQENGPLDPVFGVLLHPTSGRAGPGDSGWFHQLMFDGNGHVAYHSAVHDAFGYLLTQHNIGPGYDYMDHSKFSRYNPLAGQLDGMNFWRSVINKVRVKQNVSSLMAETVDVIQQWHPETNTRARACTF